MSLNDLLAKVAQMLGLKPSEARKLELIEQKLIAAKATNVDHIEQIKDEIRQLEGRAKKKKKELDESRGDRKRIIAGEIERTFRELDRLRGRESILSRNLDKLGMTLAKIHELRAAQNQGIEQDAIDDVAIEADSAFRDLKATDKAAADLDKIRYEAPKESEVDIQTRMDEVSGARATESELSPETQRRLKELEEE